MSTHLLNRFIQNAELFPHLLNIPSDQILLSQLNEADYHKASFLDQRIITPQLQRQTVTWRDVENFDVPNNLAPHYIFHIGHVGSTLLSRLLGECPNVLALREPQVLRDLAEISQIRHLPQSPWSPELYETRKALLVSWLSRSFRDDQRVMIKARRVMIKASSFASEIAKELIGPQNKAIFLYVSLNNYLETILAGEGSRQEASQLAGTRLLRLNQKLAEPLENLWQLSHVQQIALGWLCEMSTLMQCYEQFDEPRIHWLNFDIFLQDPVSELIKSADYFGLSLDTGTAKTLISGPIMNSYSKAPEHDYSPDLRRQLLEQARRNFAPQIKQTLNWALGLAKIHPLIDTVIQFANKDM